ncbi:hypothetical protein [Chitinophaga sp. CF418]|uniref:hypothetical protein n=1 Tax=Chitinophaga sp. CF418 TaxID=1855287 RepID=UPI00091B08D0|nr:hypothetical protein [Chitinophaga sp. CF418]SHN12252.1 hypothetical protein SAMN05216311_105294 [Chitinophaga sp. CF418]
MLTREEIKAHYYKIFLDEELSRLGFMNSLVGIKPRIENTASYLNPAIAGFPSNTTSRVFHESFLYRVQLFLVVGVPVIAIIGFIFQVGEERPLWLNIFAGLLMLPALVISWRKTMERKEHRRLEISAVGISIGRRHFPWMNIVGTMMLRRIGKHGKPEKYKLVLLLDSGEIIRHDLEYYESFLSHSRKDISVAIEHFKSKVPGW